MDSLEDQEIDKSPDSSRTAHSWPSKTPAPVEAEAEEEGIEIHGSQIVPELNPNISESTLGHQYGRLVINRSNGTSWYVNYRVRTDLGDQVISASSFPTY